MAQASLALRGAMVRLEPEDQVWVQVGVGDYIGIYASIKTDSTFSGFLINILTGTTPLSSLDAHWKVSSCCLTPREEGDTEGLITREGWPPGMS